jgi:tungstate transport system permease protein
MIPEALREALLLLRHFEGDVADIALLSLEVSLSAVALGAVLGLPLGALVAIARFRGKPAVTVAMNTFMGLPSVIVGVLVYLLLSRSGPLGPMGLLFTPTAMVIAQTCLTLPLIAALTRQMVDDAWREHGEALRSLRLSLPSRVRVLLWHTRFSLVAIVMAGCGGVISEVGAVMIVGGNIDRITRTMTTAIALETSKGDLALALALGMLLMAIVLGLNLVASVSRGLAMRRFGA